MKTPHKIFFAQKNNAKFSLHKKTTQNFICTWPEHSTIVSSWMQKSNASAVVAEKNVNITEHVVITL